MLKRSIGAWIRNAYGLKSLPNKKGACCAIWQLRFAFDNIPDMEALSEAIRKNIRFKN
jgi:hypothetical protein